MSNRQATAPSGIYTNEKWFLVAPHGSEFKTIIKTYDPRVYPHNEAIRVASVDPASEVPIEIAVANAELIVTAVNERESLLAERDRLRAAAQKFVDAYAGEKASRLGNGQARKSLDEFRAALSGKEGEGNESN